MARALSDAPRGHTRPSAALRPEGSKKTYALGRSKYLCMRSAAGTWCSAARAALLSALVCCGMHCLARGATRQAHAGELGLASLTRHARCAPAGYRDVSGLSCTAPGPVQALRLPLSTAGRAPRAPAPGRRNLRPAPATAAILMV